MRAPESQEAQPNGALTTGEVAVIRSLLPARAEPHPDMPMYMKRDQQRTNEAHDALDALAEQAAAAREGRTPTARMLDHAVKAIRVKNAALETLRAELDLPEHLAEIVEDALAKDAGRA
jgi:hypothetical protein